VSALATAALLIAQAGPAYLLPQPTPDLVAPGRPLLLTDLRYQVVDQSGLTQAFGVRVRAGNWGFFGAGVDDQQRGLSLETHRVSARFTEADGAYDIGAALRAPRFRLDTGASRRGAGQRWAFQADGAWRLSPGFELTAGYLEDREPRPEPTAPLRQGSLGVLYQPGAQLEIAASASSAQVPTVGGFEIGSDVVQARTVAAVGRAELAAEAGFERRSGRLRSDQVFASASGKIPLGSRLLADAATANRWDTALGRFDSSYGAGLTLGARRVVLARTGEAGTRTAALVRRANQRGANLRQVYDEEGLRALRETLALSPQRSELAEDLRALYQAQVEERLVPQLGLRFETARDRIRGSTTRTWIGLLGIPWPLARPLAHREASVAFLTLEYARSHQSYEVAPASIDHALSLVASLNRELELRVRWRKPGRTPLDLARVTTDPRSLEFAFAYALGR
jgi:hypothetical protein